MSWRDVVQNVGVSGLAIAALTWLARSIFQRWFARDIKEFEARLSAQYQIQVEGFKSELSQLAFENQALFLRLHEKRFEVVQKLYELLCDFERAATGPQDLESERSQTEFERFSQKDDAFRYFFDSNRLLFSESLCSKIHAFWEAVVVKQFCTIKLKPEERAKTLAEYQSKVWDLKKDIEGEFRNLTGVVERSVRTMHLVETSSRSGAEQLTTDRK
jgi:hypothetical protein